MCLSRQKKDHHVGILNSTNILEITMKVWISLVKFFDILNTGHEGPHSPNLNAFTRFFFTNSLRYTIVLRKCQNSNKRDSNIASILGWIQPNITGIKTNDTQGRWLFLTFLKNPLFVCLFTARYGNLSKHYFTGRPTQAFSKWTQIIEIF